MNLNRIMPIFMDSGGFPPFSFDPSKKGPWINISGAENQIAKQVTTIDYGCVLGTLVMPLAWTFVVSVGPIVGTGDAPGIGAGNASTDVTDPLGGDGNSVALYQPGDILVGGIVITNVGFTIDPGDVIRMRRTATQLSWSKNGGAYSAPFTHGVPGPLFPGVALYEPNDQVTGAWG